jgi:hypothetical protein
MKIYISLEEPEAVKEDLPRNWLTQGSIGIRGSSRSNGPTFVGG